MRNTSGFKSRKLKNDTKINTLHMHFLLAQNFGIGVGPKETKQATLSNSYVNQNKVTAKIYAALGLASGQC